MMLARCSAQHARVVRAESFIFKLTRKTPIAFGQQKSQSVVFRLPSAIDFSHSASRRIQQFSNAANAGNTTQTLSKSKWATRWRRIAMVVRYLRIPALIGSVYMLGYQQGVIECTRNPRLMEDQLLSAVLADVGCTSKDKVSIYSSDERPAFGISKTSMLQAKTLRIANDIIRNASLLVRQELSNAISTVREKAPQDISDERLRELCDVDDFVIFWRNALFRIEGENPNLPWKYIVADSPIPNAFVTEILPQRLFITSAMFETFIENEDELAVILGHEVSHLLLGHVSQRNALERMLRTLEVLFLSIDPTEGLVSLAVIGSLAMLRRLLVASFSRDHELEADELGLKIAAMACYDTKRGAYVMQKMHDHGIKLAGEQTRYSNLLQMVDTHPPTIERYEKILEQSKTENPDKYERCAAIHKRMFKAIFP